jgi:hypothetical protein
MMKAILRGDLLPPVGLLELPDGTIRIQDGHHRCLAYWSNWGEFILNPVAPTNRPARGGLAELYARVFPNGGR